MPYKLCLVLLFLLTSFIPSNGQKNRAQKALKKADEINKTVDKKNFEKDILQKISEYPEDSSDPEKLKALLELSYHYKKTRRDSLKLSSVNKIFSLADRKKDFKILSDALKIKLFHSIMNFEKSHAIKVTKELYDLSAENNNQNGMFDALNARIGIYQDYDSQKQIETIKQAIKIAKTDLQKASVYNTYASCLRLLQKDSSEYYYTASVKFAIKSKDSIRLSATYRDYGYFLGLNYRFNESLNALLQGLDYVPKNKMFDFNRIEIIKRIVFAYTSLEDYDQAIEYVKKALAIAELRNYKSAIGSVSKLYGELLMYKEEWADANIYLDKSYAHFQKSKNAPMVITTGSDLGITFLKLGEIKKARKIYQTLLSKKRDGKEMQFSNYRLIKLGYTLDNHDGNYLSAIKKMQQALKIITTSNQAKERVELLKDLAVAEQKIGNLDQSNFYYQKAFTLKDSIYNSDLIKTTKELEAKYTAKEQEKEIASLNKDNVLKSKLLDQRTWLLALSGIALLLISLLLISLFFFYKKIKIKNDLVNKALEEKDFLLREIHHRVKNNLQVVSSLLSLQSRQIEDTDIRTAIDEGRNRVRSMALIHQNLYQNDSLSGVSVTGYLDNLISELFSTYNISTEEVTLEMDIEEIALDIDTMVPLGLIINELISNCLKHAFPNSSNGRISVKLIEQNNEIHLSVKDNGIGIDTGKFNKSKSFGKKLINAFSKKLNAEIITTIDQGTKITMIIKKYKKAA